MTLMQRINRMVFRRTYARLDEIDRRSARDVLRICANAGWVVSRGDDDWLNITTPPGVRLSESTCAFLDRLRPQIFALLAERDGRRETLQRMLTAWAADE